MRISPLCLDWTWLKKPARPVERPLSRRSGRRESSDRRRLARSEATPRTKNCQAFVKRKHYRPWIESGSAIKAGRRRGEETLGEGQWGLSTHVADQLYSSDN